MCGPLVRFVIAGNDAWATPPISCSDTGCCATVSIVNVTMPVGMPVPVVGATIAVNVTA